MEALLSLWPGAMPASASCSYAEAVLSCPVLLLLQRHLEAAAVTAAHAVAAAVPSGQRPSLVEHVMDLMAAVERRSAGAAALDAPGQPPPADSPGAHPDEPEQVAGPMPASPGQAQQARQRAHEAAWAQAAWAQAEPRLGRLEARAVRIMDALVGAGARVNVYCGGLLGPGTGRRAGCQALGCCRCPTDGLDLASVVPATT